MNVLKRHIHSIMCFYIKSLQIGESITTIEDGDQNAQTLSHTCSVAHTHAHEVCMYVYLYIDTCNEFMYRYTYIIYIMYVYVYIDTLRVCIYRHTYIAHPQCVCIWIYIRYIYTHAMCLCIDIHTLYISCMYIYI